MNIPNVTHYIHAYKVAPWRIQRQWIGLIFLLVVVLAMVATLYLNITSGTAIAGREIQNLTASITRIQQETGDLQTELASLTSASSMEQRALEMGFRPVEIEEVEYVIVAGYVQPEPFLIHGSQQARLQALTIVPEYNQSLFDWMDEKISNTVRGVQ